MIAERARSRTRGPPNAEARRQRNAMEASAPRQHARRRRPHISNALAVLSGGKSLISEKSLFAAVAYLLLPERLRLLPIVDVGTHYGLDLTIPAAQHGHRVYAYEPTPSVYNELVTNMRRKNLTSTRSIEFFHGRVGKEGLRRQVLLRPVAVSNTTGVANLTTSWAYSGVANTLSGPAGLPPSYVSMPGTFVKTLRVNTVRLSDELAPEKDGVFLLKIDAQGHELHVLRGAEEYIRSHDVYVILLEFSPFLLKAAHVDPMELLTLLTVDLGYQCFDGRRLQSRGFVHRERDTLSMTLEQFVAAYSAETTKKKRFGEWTDLLCVRLDLLRRRRR